MPQYDYHCEKCNKTFTVTRTWEEFDKKRKPKCPKCGKSGDVEQVFSNVTVKTSKKS
ncbi:MAG: FmdB family zinc ribbon protein [Candidatus Brocadiia bacterium]